MAFLGIDVSATISNLLQAAIDKLIAWLPKSITTLVQKVIDGITSISTIFTRVETLLDSIKDEVTEWRNFREDAKFKSKVISVPKAWEQTKEFIGSFSDTWRAIQDLVRRFKERLGENPTAEAEAAATDIEESGGEALLKRLPRLARGVEKILGVVTLVVDALENISAAIDDVQQLVDEVSRIRTEIEELDTIFLQQKNSRRTLRTQDGQSIKIRVGSLHAA
jgi:hypothetical protein